MRFARIWACCAGDSAALSWAALRLAVERGLATVLAEDIDAAADVRGLCDALLTWFGDPVRSVGIPARAGELCPPVITPAAPTSGFPAMFRPAVPAGKPAGTMYL